MWRSLKPQLLENWPSKQILWIARLTYCSQCIFFKPKNKRIWLNRGDIWMSWLNQLPCQIEKRKDNWLHRRQCYLLIGKGVKKYFLQNSVSFVVYTCKTDTFTNLVNWFNLLLITIHNLYLKWKLKSFLKLIWCELQQYLYLNQ